MPTFKVFDTIKQVIKEQTDNCNSFTAFDITLLAQKKLSGIETFLHKDVKQYIHDTLANFITSGKYLADKDPIYPATRYKCYSKPAQKTQTNPWPNSLPKPSTETIKQKGEELIKEMNKLVGKPIITPIEKTSLTDKLKIFMNTVFGPLNSQPKIILTTPTLEKYNIKRDKRKRLCVPKLYTKTIGLKPDDYVALVDNFICHSSQCPPGKIGYVQYTVDNHGNIRISNATLIKLGIKETDKVNLKVQNNKIYIEKGV